MMNLNFGWIGPFPSLAAILCGSMACGQAASASVAPRPIIVDLACLGVQEHRRAAIDCREVQVELVPLDFIVGPAACFDAQRFVSGLFRDVIDRSAASATKRTDGRLEFSAPKVGWWVPVLHCDGSRYCGNAVYASPMVPNSTSRLVKLDSSCVVRPLPAQSSSADSRKSTSFCVVSKDRKWSLESYIVTKTRGSGSASGVVPWSRSWGGGDCYHHGGATTIGVGAFESVPDGRPASVDSARLDTVPIRLNDTAGRGVHCMDAADPFVATILDGQHPLQRLPVGPGPRDMVWISASAPIDATPELVAIDLFGARLRCVRVQYREKFAVVPAWGAVPVVAFSLDETSQVETAQMTVLAGEEARLRIGAECMVECPWSYGPDAGIVVDGHVREVGRKHIQSEGGKPQAVRLTVLKTEAVNLRVRAMGRELTHLRSADAFDGNGTGFIFSRIPRQSDIQLTHSILQVEASVADGLWVSMAVGMPLEIFINDESLSSTHVGDLVRIADKWIDVAPMKVRNR